jgi:hypothetical protein
VLAGRTLADPTAPWEKQAAAAVEEVFGTERPGRRDQVLALLLDAEDAYFHHLGDTVEPSRWNPSWPTSPARRRI